MDIKISNISKYKGMTYMVEIEGREEPEFINLEIINMFSLKAGASLPLSAWEQIKGEDLYRKARERALYLLDYKDYSYIDMFNKLMNNYPEDTCYRVMDKLVEIGCINDRRYAEGLARKYVEVKKFGRYRAVREMKGKGLTNEVIDEALEPYSDGWYDRCRELTEAKYVRYLDDDKGVNRVKNALVRNGYTYDVVNEVIKDIMEEIEDE